jgi:serine/threonine-protein kinase
MIVDEARLASAIDHPNVVKVRELGFDNGMPFIVMDYIEGASLADLRRELSAMQRAIDVRVAVRIVLDALMGLHAAHELTDASGRPLHIIHRDVSPHNVLIGCDGRSHLTDFGIAQAEDRIQTTRTHEVKGKLAYLAPERVDKRRVCTIQSDVFSMAVVLWECFAGRRLFRSDSAVDVLQEVISAPIPTLKQLGAAIPPALDDAIARALSRDLDTRFASALEFAAAIERAAGPGDVGSHSDVARLVEAIFASRMALRQEHVRAAIGASDLAELLRESGLPARRPLPHSEISSGELLEELAPPAPSGRYILGSDLERARGWRRYRSVPWWSLPAVACGILIGAVVTLAVIAGRSRQTPILVATPASPAGAHSIASAATRRVLLPLPFPSTHVTFDDESRDLDPASDVLAFDVEVDSGTRHRISAIAADGTRADGYAQEDDGIARVEGDGYTFAAAPRSGSEVVRRAGTGRDPRSVGTVRNGFTKLR